MTHYWRRFFLVLLLAVLFAGGLAVRRCVLEAQYQIHGRDLPFTLESALTFRYVRLVSEQGALPVWDGAVQYPDGVKVYETYTIGLEYVWSWLADSLPKRLSLTERVRWVSAAWFCLGIIFLFAWLYAAWGSATGAGFGAACYAVSLASVIRSTGQELSDENFALPLVIAAFAACAWARRQARVSAFVLGAVFSALLLAWALTAWDLVQVVVLFGAGLGWVAHTRGRLSGRMWAHWLIALAVLVGVGWVNPYLRAHHFPASFGMLLAYGVTASRFFGLAAGHICGAPARSGNADPRPSMIVSFLNPDTLNPGSLPPGLCAGFWRYAGGAALRGGLALVLAAAGAWLAEGYAGTYGHFLGLLGAKLRFLNRKPADPALLTFDQAILWTPALNSATFRLTRTLFPATLWINALAMAWALFVRRCRAVPIVGALLAASWIAWPAFFLFERFHVFVAILSAAWVGWLASQVMGLRPLSRWLLAGLGYALIMEGNQVLSAPERWGRPWAYYQQKQDLVRWFREQTASEPVLANFGLSGTLLAYADCPIILHPKFEGESVRRLVEGYGRALFLGDERVFRDWADARGARYYVHSMGEFSGVAPELQMRYFVGALDPPVFAAARFLEFAPEDLRYFIPLYHNIKYRVYRIVTRSDQRQAGRLLAAAAGLRRRGNLDMAETLATLAMQYDPRGEEAPRFLLDLAAFRQQGQSSNPSPP
jgi:hypothetical protein